MTALIVDDNPDDRKLLRLLCEQRGLAVEEAGDGREALAAMARRRPDLVISDALMPEMDGFHLLRRIRTDPALRDIPVVICSAVYQGGSERELAAALGADGFLDKPLQAEALASQIDGVGRAGRAARSVLGLSDRLLKVDEEFLRRYSGIVTETLEQKVSQLAREIEERQRGEAELRAAQAEIQRALQEKEVLLREVHHRVKNNMQVISSLLNLQVQRAGGSELARLYEASQRRIRSIARVHEKLYKTRDQAALDFGDYIKSLIPHLFHVRGLDPNRVRPCLDVEPLPIEISRAVPLALLLGEMVVNALQHAFPEGRGGEIRIGFRAAPEGRLALTVEDTGVGLPEGLDIRTADTLGLQIIHLLADQIQAEVMVRTDRQAGTAFTVAFDRRA